MGIGAAKRLGEKWRDSSREAWSIHGIHRDPPLSRVEDVLWLTRNGAIDQPLRRDFVFPANSVAVSPHPGAPSAAFRREAGWRTLLVFSQF